MTQPQRRMVFAISGTLVMSLFALPHSAFAQASVQNPKSQNSSNQTGAVIRSTSRLVLLDVVVTDKSGSMERIGKAVFYYQRELNERFMSVVT